MDNSSDKQLFLDALDHIVLEALTAIRNDPQSRFALFRRLLEVAREEVGVRNSRRPSRIGHPLLGRLFP